MKTPKEISSLEAHDAEVLARILERRAAEIREVRHVGEIVRSVIADLQTQLPSEALLALAKDPDWVMANPQKIATLQILSIGLQRR